MKRLKRQWLYPRRLFSLKPGWIFGLVWIVLARPILGQQADTNPVVFRQDFRGKGINYKFFQTTGPIEQIQESAEGLVISLPGEGKSKAAGIKTIFPIRGDFELTSSYQFVRLDQPQGKAYSQVGVSLYFKALSEAGEAAQLSRVNNPGDATTYRCTKIFTVDGGKRQFQPTKVTTKVLSGQLRLVRRGDNVSYLVKDEDSPDFRELRQVTLSTNDLDWSQIVAETDGVTPVEVRILDYEVRGQGLPNQLSQETPPRSRNVVTVALVGAVLLLVLFGLGLWHRSRKTGANAEKPR